MEKRIIRAIPNRINKIFYPCENTSKCHPIWLVFDKGTYKIELWGAGTTAGGGYTSGIIHFYNKTSLFLLIGGVALQGDLIGIGGYNGGGTSQIIGRYYNDIRQAGGDGATDLRINETDLHSRIMVSGGAGGGTSSYKGGFGGGLIGGDGICFDGSTVGKGGNQTNGGNGRFSGEFGIGATSHPSEGTDLAGCGGGGYFGGGSGYHIQEDAAGGGGSSYISGYKGCEIHESNYIFYDAKMISGNESMPYIDGSFRKGPFGNGFARIKCVDASSTCKYERKLSRYTIVLIITFSSN